MSLSNNSKSKPQYDTSSYLLGCLKNKKNQRIALTVREGEGVEEPESLKQFVSIQMIYTTWEVGLTDFRRLE